MVHDQLVDKIDCAVCLGDLGQILFWVRVTCENSPIRHDLQDCGARDPDEPKLKWQLAEALRLMGSYLVANGDPAKAVGPLTEPARGALERHLQVVETGRGFRPFLRPA